MSGMGNAVNVEKQLLLAVHFAMIVLRKKKRLVKNKKDKGGKQIFYSA